MPSPITFTYMSMLFLATSADCEDHLARQRS